MGPLAVHGQDSFLISGWLSMAGQRGFHPFVIVNVNECQPHAIGAAATSTQLSGRQSEDKRLRGIKIETRPTFVESLFALALSTCIGPLQVHHMNSEAED